MKKLLCTCLAVAAMTTASAQDSNKWLNLQGEVRVDYQREYLDGHAVKPNSGFKGKNVNIILNGHITDKFSYAYRQRLNKAHSDQSFFDATDWAYLNYQANENWSIAAGKQVVAIGGYEYDRAPIDAYFSSEYCNNIACYQLGVNVAYMLNNGKDKFQAQFCQSPFDRKDDDTYAYNLMWIGSHDWFNTLYSANMLEYRPGKFMYYLALGNQFNFGNFRLQLDLMNRATDDHAFFFKDCSVMGELACEVSKHVNVFGKVTYDVNNTGREGDYCVMSGTELTRVGAGIEYFPLKDGNRNIRLHAHLSYAWGTNSNEAGTMLDKQSLFNVGLKWKVDLLSFARK